MYTIVYLILNRISSLKCKLIVQWGLCILLAAYSDEEEMIPKNSSVIVARIPVKEGTVPRGPKKMWVMVYQNFILYNFRPDCKATDVVRLPIYMYLSV